MKWYDVFSNFYDSSLEKLYFNTRKRAIEQLKLKPNLSVLDVACGTGSNFRHIKEIDTEIALYATDFSEGMLRRAKQSIKTNNWTDITLFQSDARKLSPSLIKEKTKEVDSFDRIICVLGLSVIPNWELVLDKMIDLLRPNGKIVIVDVYAEKRNFNTWLVEKVARADLNRKIWQQLKEKTSDFELEYSEVKENKVGGKLFIACGSKLNY